MPSVTSKIATPMILAGIFIMVVFVAANYEVIGINFYIVFALVLVYVFFFGFAIGQNFSLPLKKLLRRANELSQGNLKTRVYLENKDEIGELARVFNKIADNLEQSHTETEETERSVDVRVKAKTEALEETINALEQKVKNRTIELERANAEIERFKQQPKKK